MSKTKRWILLAACLVVLAVIAGLLIWFFSPGIHVIGPFIHADMEASCILLDPEDLSFAGKSTLTISLTGYGKREGLLPEYNGMIDVAGYSVESGEMIQNNGFASYDVTTGRWFLTYRGTSGADFTSTGYTAFFHQNAPLEMVVVIRKEGKLHLIAVLAADEAQAQAIYRNHLASFRE